MAEALLLFAATLIAGFVSGYAAARLRPCHRVSNWAWWTVYARVLTRSSWRWWACRAVFLCETAVWLVARPRKLVRRIHPSTQEPTR